MTPGACRDVWACLVIIVGLTSPVAGDSPPIELAHGGRLPGRILETDDAAEAEGDGDGGGVRGAFRCRIYSTVSALLL
jgi:hypothetical protein